MPNEPQQIDTGTLIWGVVLGFVIGAVAMLFNAPASGRETLKSLTGQGRSLRNKLETAVPGDPVAESLAQGKEAARKRRAELGLDAE